MPVRRFNRKPVNRGPLKKRAVRRNLKPNRQESENSEKPLDLNVNVNAKDYFSKNATFDQHFQAQETNRDKYVATVMAFDEYNIEIIANSRARSLAAALARHDKDLIEFYLNNQKQISLTDVLKASIILDSRREKKAIEKKIEIVTKDGRVMKAKKLGKLKNDINNLEKLVPKLETRSFGCSGAMARKIRKWTQKFSENELEFFCLSMPIEPWKKLADIYHLNPKKDFQAPWFLPFCFGEKLPENSRIEKLKNMTPENVNNLVKEFDNIPYSYLKKFKTSLNDESKEKIAQHEKLDTIIWYYEDLSCKAVDNIIKARLEKGDRIELGYGKLMERVLLFKDIQDGKMAQPKNELASEFSSALFKLLISEAEKQLKNFKATLKSPVAVLGDASSSMDVAIRTSTIISSLLAAICQAKLTFFNSKNFESNYSNPKNVNEVIQIANSTKASGSTSPAASLVPYYDKKEVVKTFIIVTDEEENTEAKTNDGKSWGFYKLFMEYRKNVYPATLIFVSFLSSQHDNGQMFRDFVMDKVEDVTQFKFDANRPDLTKLDSILGSICSKSCQSFSGLVEKLESDIKTKGLIDTFNNLKMNMQTQNSSSNDNDFVLV